MSPFSLSKDTTKSLASSSSPHIMVCPVDNGPVFMIR